MKKQSLLVGMFAICATSLQASAMSTINTPAKAANSQLSTVDVEKKIALKHVMPSDAKEVSTSVSVNYLGGYFGPSNTIIAQDGVYSTVSTANSPQEYIYADLSWSNGVEVSVSYSTGTGYSLRAYYSFLTNNTNTSSNFTKATTYSNAASTLSIAGYATGTSGQVTAANGSYKLSGRNLGILETQHMLFESDTVKALGSIGGAIGYLSHSSSYNLTQYISGNISNNLAVEQTLFGGPTGSFLISKFVGAGFSFYASARLTVNGAGVKHHTTEQSYTGTTLNGFTVNSKSTVNKLYNEEEFDLGVFWTHEMNDGSLITLNTDWKGGFTGDSTMLFSSSSGTQSLRDQGLIFGLLSVGLYYTY